MPKSLNWFLTAILFTLTNCSFQISSPKPSDPTATVNGFTVLPSGHIEINVVFNEDVDPNTVIVGKTLFLKFTKNANEDATLLWDPGSKKKLKITTVDKRDDLMVFDPDDGFLLTIVGRDAGNGAVKSVGGTLLDGDYDGKAGGDYRMSFTIIG